MADGFHGIHELSRLWFFCKFANEGVLNGGFNEGGVTQFMQILQLVVWLFARRQERVGGALHTYQFDDKSCVFVMWVIAAGYKYCIDFRLSRMTPLNTYE